MDVLNEIAPGLSQASRVRVQEWTEWVGRGVALALGMFLGLCILVCSLIAILVGGIAYEEGVLGGEPVAFDAAEWRDNDTFPFRRPIRFRMSGDLVAGRVLLGKTDVEVLELLGPPDWQHGSWELGYRLRTTERGWDGPRVDALTINLERGVVVSVKGPAE